MDNIKHQKDSFKKPIIFWCNLKKIKRLFSLLKCFKITSIRRIVSMEDLCLQNSKASNFDNRVVHEIPSSLIELTKEEKKRLEYTLIRNYLEDYLLWIEIKAV